MFMRSCGTASAAIILLASSAFAITLFPDTPTSWPVGNNPRGAAIGDVNGDGAADVVVVNTDDNTYTLLLNDGSGAFPTSVTLSSGDHEPRYVALADLDGTGEVDMVIPCTDGGTSVFLNTGFGFAHTQTVDAGAGPWHCTVADFDGKPGLDVLVSCPWSYELIMLKNDGSGTFTAVHSNIGSPGPGYLDAADIDGDGHVDAIYARHLAGADWLGWARNDGHGAFTETWGEHLPTHPGGVAVDDFDGDGLQDIALGQHRPADPDNLRLYFGLPEGGFAAPIMIGDISHAVQVKKADLDQDGDSDLVCIELYNRQITILYNDGQGGFPYREILPTLSGPYGLAIGDLDGDEVPDIAVGCTGELEDRVQIFLSAYPTAAPPAAPARAQITGCYPNPFNPTGRIGVSLPHDAVVSLDIFDIEGRRVLRLHEGPLAAGDHGFDWTGRDQNGQALPGGVYLASLRGAGSEDAEKLVLVK